MIEPSLVSSTELFGLLFSLKPYFFTIIESAWSLGRELRITVMLRVLPSPLPAIEILPGLVEDPGAMDGFRATLYRLITEPGFSESSRTTEDSSPAGAGVIEALRFYMLAFTMFLKLTVIGFDLRVLIERRGFEDSYNC